jgi:hypothetical protein
VTFYSLEVGYPRPIRGNDPLPADHGMQTSARHSFNGKASEEVDKSGLIRLNLRQRFFRDFH